MEETSDASFASPRRLLREGVHVAEGSVQSHCVEGGKGNEELQGNGKCGDKLGTTN